MRWIFFHAILLQEIVCAGRGGITMGGIHEGHRARMRKKLMESGERVFADHELLEVLLYYAIPRRDTNELAHRLLEQFGSLQGVLSAPAQELACVKGVGEYAAALIKLVPILQRRAARSAKEQILNSVDKCGAYFTALLSGSRREMLWQVCLDGKGKVLSSRCLAEGDVNMAAVSVRQVVEYALHAGAVGVVLAHNHPSGVALPSREDIGTTRLIRDALRTMNIQLVDHIVVADGDFVSMAASGMLI